MFKRSTHRPKANEAPTIQSTAVKPVAVFDEDDQNFLCQLEETYRPHYLQLPIKIQPRSSSIMKARKQSQSYSEELIPLNESFKSMKDDFNINMATTREDVLMLENQLKAFHMIEQCISSLHKSQNQPNFRGQEESESNMSNAQAADQSEQTPVLDQDLFSLPNQSAEMNPIKRLLLGLINDYQAYDQSLKVVMNFHNLQKRDYLFKMFGNILGVISRQNKKMENGLCVELRKAGFGVDRTAGTKKNMMEEEESPIYPCKALFKATPDSKKSKGGVVEKKPLPDNIFYEDDE